MSSNEKAHKHRHATEHAKGLWLELIESAASTMSGYDYCPECGSVRQKTDPGRRNEFFFTALSRLKKSLSSGEKKLTESQARLIVRSISADGALNDTYASSYESQADRFVEIVRKVRPDLDEDTIKHSALIRR